MLFLPSAHPGCGPVGHMWSMQLGIKIFQRTQGACYVGNCLRKNRTGLDGWTLAATSFCLSPVRLVSRPSLMKTVFGLHALLCMFDVQYCFKSASALKKSWSLKKLCSIMSYQGWNTRWSCVQVWVGCWCSQKSYDTMINIFYFVSKVICLVVWTCTDAVICITK